MRYYIISLISAFCLLFNQNSFADTPQNQSSQAILQEANALFAEGKDLSETERAKRDDLYKKSLLRYEQLINEFQIKNAGLYYNVANIYYLLGDVGHAILNYKRAYNLDPDDSNIIENLDFVRQRRSDKIEDSSSSSTLKTVFFWHYSFSQLSKFKIASLAGAIFWILLSLRLFSNVKISRIFIILSLLIAIIFTISGILQKSKIEAVITSPEVIARKGDGISYEASFTTPLHTGTEVVILEKRADWLNVELPNGITCWLPASSVEEV